MSRSERGKSPGSTSCRIWAKLPESPDFQIVSLRTIRVLPGEYLVTGGSVARRVPVIGRARAPVVGGGIPAPDKLPSHPPVT